MNLPVPLALGVTPWMRHRYPSSVSQYKASQAAQGVALVKGVWVSPEEQDLPVKGCVVVLNSSKLISFICEEVAEKRVGA